MKKIWVLFILLSIFSCSVSAFACGGHGGENPEALESEEETL